MNIVHIIDDGHRT